MQLPASLTLKPTAMKIKTFFEQHSLSTKGIELRESSKTYEDSTDKILYIQLPMEVEEQDFLVCSHTLAQKLRDKSLTLREAEVVHSDVGFGLICPQTTTVIETIDL